MQTALRNRYTAPTAFAASHIGMRDNQEDAGAFVHGPNAFLAVVCDGMGGAANGEVASRIAVATLEQQYQSGCESTDLQKAVREANKAVYKESRTSGQHGMGTTVVAFAHGPHESTIVHAGDSRCYLLRGGTLRQLTKDHGPSDKEIAQGVEALRRSNISSERLEVLIANYELRQKNTIFCCLGSRSDESGSMQSVYIRKRDTLLLCSDGLNVLDSTTITSILVTSSNPAAALISAVLVLEKPHQDNVTAIVLRF